MPRMTTPACTLCQPVALEALLQGNALAASQWASLARVTLEPGQALVNAGAAVTQTWWVEKGLLRSYYLDSEGGDCNRGFHSEGDWVGHGLPPVDSISEYHVQALEPSTLVALPYPTLRALLQAYPALQGLLHEAQNSLMAAQARREASLLGHTHAQRYQAFRQTHAHLLGRVPLHHVARYLGVSNVSLSRIRARLGLLEQD